MGAEDQVAVMRARRRESAASAFSFIAMVSVWLTMSEKAEGFLLRKSAVRRRAYVASVVVRLVSEPSFSVWGKVRISWVEVSWDLCGGVGTSTLGGPWKMVASVLSASWFVLVMGISRITQSSQARDDPWRGINVDLGIEEMMLRSLASHLRMLR